MAQTYTHTPALSKVKLGATTYYLKDADVRAILDTFGDVVTYDVATSNAAFAENNESIPTAGQVYDYVGRQIGAIGQALNLLEASDHTQVENPQPGDFVVETGGKEWLYDGSAWREIGSENAYVVKTFTIAGIDMQDNITAAELKTALGLKALAFKDSGSVDVTTPDGVNSFSTGKAGEYDVVASEVSVPATYSALDVTPAGSVALTAGTAAAASYKKTTGVTVSSAAAGEGTPNYTPAGTVTVTEVSVTPSNVSVAKVTSAGTAYQLTDGNAVKGSDTKSAFATAGLVAAIDENDAEMLVFSNASTADAVTASGDVTYTAPVLTGSLPTFGTESVVKGITSASATAEFAGTGAIISAEPTYSDADATMTQPTFTAAFEGTAKTVTPAAATTIKAAAPGGKVTVASETITPTLDTSAKTVAVDFA